MMSNRTVIVRTQIAQRLQCTHCSQKPVTDINDNQMAPVLYKKSPVVHQCLILILPRNADGIYRELPLFEDLFEETNVDVVCIQATIRQPNDVTPELRNFSAVRPDRQVQREERCGPYDLHP